MALSLEPRIGSTRDEQPAVDPLLGSCDPQGSDVQGCGGSDALSQASQETAQQPAASESSFPKINQLLKT